MVSGTYTDGGSRLAVPRNPAGATPTMFSRRPFTRRTSPTTSVAPATVGDPEVMAEDGDRVAADRLVDFAAEETPAKGLNRSVGKYDPETHDAQTLALRPPYDRWARSV